MRESNEIALIQSAIGMQDELKRRSVEIDKQGYLPQDLACQLSALGFYRLIVPESLGGLVSRPKPSARFVNTWGVRTVLLLGAFYWYDIAISIWGSAE